MRNVIRWIGVVAVLSLVLSLTLVYAQDATPEATPAASTGTTGTNATCDSNLILQLYIAERYFGFGAVHNNMVQNGSSSAQPLTDLNTFDKGQYSPWFDTLNTNMGSSMMMPDTSMNSDQMANLSTMMNQDDATLSQQMSNGVDTSTMTTLNPYIAPADEAPECSALRSELNRFYNVLAYQDFSNGMSTSTGNG